MEHQEFDVIDLILSAKYIAAPKMILLPNLSIIHRPSQTVIFHLADKKQKSHCISEVSRIPNPT